MLGAIIGDTVGSRFEWHNHKSKEFEFLTYQCQLTDDSIMTLAVADAILKSCDDRSDLSELTIHSMQQMGRLYPNAGYGLSFQSWIQSPSAKPYESFGNGAAMRISPVGFAARSMEETKSMSEAVTRVTHNHPEGIKGARQVMRKDLRRRCIPLYRRGSLLCSLFGKGFPTEHASQCHRRRADHQGTVCHFR